MEKALALRSLSFLFSFALFVNMKYIKKEKDEGEALSRATPCVRIRRLPIFGSEAERERL